MSHLRVSLVALLLVVTLPIFPCTCGPDPTQEIGLELAFRNSPVVFSGSVIRVATDPDTDVTRFTFQITRYFKGSGGSRLQVVTTGGCRAYFSRELPYFVFAGYVTDPSLRGQPFTSQCSGNRLVSSAPDFRRVLGVGSAPVSK